MTDLATLGLAIDSSPAAKAAADLDKFSAAAVRAEKSADDVAKSANKAADGARKASSGTAQFTSSLNSAASANDNAAGAINRHAAAIIKLTEAERRMSGSFGRGADIAAYSQELDRLRAKFNPLFAASQQYKGALSEIRDAHRVGAISATEMADAVSRQKTAFASQVVALRNIAPAVTTGTTAMRTFTKAAKETNVQVANVTAQFQDIAVTAAMGMNPLQIALQQGTQLSGAFGNAKGLTVVKALGSALASLVSPVSLVTIGLVAGTAAFIQWAASGKKGSEELETSLQRHQEAVRLLTDLYGENSKAAEAAGTAGGKAFSAASVRTDVRKLQRQLQEQATQMMPALSGTDGFIDKGLSYLGIGNPGAKNLKLSTDDELQFKDAVDSLLRSIRAGKTDLGAFDAQVEGIYERLTKGGKATENLRDTADAIESTADAVFKVGGKFSAFQDPINKLKLGIEENTVDIQAFNAEVEKIGEDKGFGALADEAIALGASLIKVADALNQIEAARQKATEAVRQHLATERNSSSEIKTYNEQLQRQRDIEDNIADARIRSLRATTDAEKVAAAGNEARAQNPINGPDQRRAIAAAEKQTQAELDQAYKQSAIDRARSYEDAIRQGEEQISLIGKTTAEVAALQFQYQSMADLREEAARTGRDIDDKEIAAIKEKAAAIGALAAQAEKLKLDLDLQFEMDNFGKSPIEQKISERLRGTGLDANSTEAQTMRQLDTMEKAKDAASNFFDAIENGVMNGGDDIGAALVDSLVDWMAGIGKANLQKAFDIFSTALAGGGATTPSAAKANASSSGSGILSGIGNWVSGLFGGSSMATAQNKQIQSRAAKVSITPVTNVMGSLAEGVQKTAKDLGVAARDVAAAISYETGGTFDKWQKGPTTQWGEHRGLIQWGEPQRQQYGVTSAMSAAEQMGKVTLYLRNAGVKAGMGLKDIYSAINAGHVGLYNRSDANNGGAPGTVADKVNNQMAGHYVNADKLLGGSPNLATAVAKGTASGTFAANTATIQTMGGGGASGGAGAVAAPGSGVMGALGAGLGGFGLGAQSGSPIMGALGGAVSGFGSFGIPGAIIGGIAGLFGGIFGGNQKKKQEKNAAKATLNENRGAIADYLTVTAGGQPGSYMSQWNQIRDQGIQFEQQANKAGEKSTTGKQIIDAINTSFIRLWHEQGAGFQGTVQAYSSGLGQDSGFLQGKSAVEGLRDELKGFIKDIGDMRDKAIELNAIAPEQVASYQEGTKAAVQQAQIAAQRMALATLTGAQSFTEMETQVQKLDGASVALKETLQQLGMTADDADEAISKALGLTMAKLRDSFTEDLNSSINDKSGLGFLNDFVAAQRSYQERLRDGAQLGIDGSLALKEFNLTIKGIAEGADLSKEEIDQLSQAFPTMATTLQSLDEKTVSLTDAQGDLSSAYDKASGDLEDSISGLESFSKAIQDFLDSMKIDDSSPLAPDAKLAEAAKQFRDTATKAAGGDKDAQGNLTNVAQSYLDAGKDYYASAQGYQTIWQEVSDTLTATKATADKSLSDSKAQLQALKDQVGKLIDIDDSVMSVADAVNALNDASQRSLADLKTQLGATLTNGSGSIEAAYQSSLNRAPTASESAYWQGQLNSGSTIDQVTGSISNSFEAQLQSMGKQILGHPLTNEDLAYWKSTGITKPEYIAGAMSSSFEGQLNSAYKSIFNRNVDSASLQYWQSTGKSIDDITKDLQWAKDTGSFASGGYTGDMGTSAIAGVVHGQEYVMPADQTSKYRSTLDAMRSGTYGANDNGSAADDAQSARAERAAMLAELRNIRMAIGIASVEEIKCMTKNTTELADLSGEIKRANASK